MKTQLLQENKSVLAHERVAHGVMCVSAFLVLASGLSFCEGCAQRGRLVTTPGLTERAIPQAGLGAGGDFSAQITRPKILPSESAVGRVIMVNYQARFVVLGFAYGPLPGVDQRLDVYRTGQKIGVVKVSGPQLNNNIVADILEGDCHVGDEVRSQ